MHVSVWRDVFADFSFFRVLSYRLDAIVHRDFIFYKCTRPHICMYIRLFECLHVRFSVNEHVVPCFSAIAVLLLFCGRLKGLDFVLKKNCVETLINL